MAVDKFSKIRDLRIEALTGNVLVNNVSLELKRGEVLGLIGESGAGKSTIGIGAMAYARAGCRITGGTIEIDGISIRDLSADGRRDMRGQRIAYIAQSAAASFNPAHTLIDQVMRNADPARPDEAGRGAKPGRSSCSRRWICPTRRHFGDRYPHQVSGGQLQRAMTAMAMSCRPDMLVFDEPTTALDVTTQIEVLALIKKIIRDYNTAALYITHDLAVVAQVSDRIMVLRGGKMIEIGDTGANPVRSRKTLHPRAGQRAQAGRPSVLDARQAARGNHSRHQECRRVLRHFQGGQRRVAVGCAKAETVAVVGESGSGKSSLARLIVGLLPRASGSVKFKGKELSVALKERSKDDLRKIQFIYQLPDVALNPRQTIGEIIGRPVQFYFNKSGRPKSKHAWPNFCGRWACRKTMPDACRPQLSGGQKQRICIARALAADPDLIICDEPTSALDQLVADEILKLLKKLQDELGVAYLFITHDLGIVRRIAHRTAVMLKGELVAEGPTPEFSPPFHPYTENLLLPCRKCARIGSTRCWRVDRRLDSRGAAIGLEQADLPKQPVMENRHQRLPVWLA